MITKITISQGNAIDYYHLSCNQNYYFISQTGYKTHSQIESDYVALGFITEKKLAAGFGMALIFICFLEF